MRRTLVVLSLFIASAALAQLRGTGRLQGNVTDKTTGKPIAGATISVTTAGSNTRPIVTKTDGRGHWAALGMTAGQWNVDITAPGYVTSRGTANVSEVQSAPPIKIALEPEVKQAPPEVAPAGPTVPKEAVDAIEEGQTLLRATTASADEAKRNAARAVADFERALPMIADDKPELRDLRNQVLNIEAQAYYKAGDVKNAIATLERVPSTATRDVLLANLYLENGQLNEGKSLLEKLPATAITDPTAYVNIGILFLNKKDPATAITYFGKAIAINPKEPESYYYRGLAEVQLNKSAAAKTDLQQVISLAPDSQEAKDAKQLLAGMK